ncbi:hypothetical protein V9L05_12400 [Bernardetia sp. Wsw4-3y2]|uniref:hypothetical protein n=1 Tax=Bernardetia sp. Wsw4-3y2 TaxID=3127471 RepID=UPI0030D15510
MRKVANLPNPTNDIVRLMIYESEDGIYLFGYKKVEDCGGEWDEMYRSVEDCIYSCESQYGVKAEDWFNISDPKPYCQHDWINPVRVKGREIGKPQFGTLEKLINGKWVEFNPKN